MRMSYLMKEKCENDENDLASIIDQFHYFPFSSWVVVWDCPTLEERLYFEY